MAVRKGLKRATGDVIIIQDADLEYDVNDYAKLIAPILDDKVDFVLGSRNFDTKDWKIRKMKGHRLNEWLLNISGYAFNTLFNIVYQSNYVDQATMYKVFRRDLLDYFTLESNYFALDVELLAKLTRTRCRREEIHVNYSARTLAEGKKTRFLRELFTLSWALFKYRFVKVKKYRKR